MIFKNLTFFLSIFLCSGLCQAAEGCKIGNDLFYGNPFGTLYPSSPSISTNCPTPSSAISHADNLVLFRFLGSPIVCTRNGGVSAGLIYTFDIVPCPLDCTIIWLIVASGILGFLIIKRFHYQNMQI